ncbi:hypothetical protein Tco_0041847 [Tanacetum coccineum]
MGDRQKWSSEDQGHFDILGHIRNYKIYGVERVDTAYWCDPIQRIELAYASTIVEIDLTWSLRLVSVDLASVEARIFLIKLEFSSCLFADSP